MKKTVRLFYILLLATGCLLPTACEDYLNREPLSEVLPENFFKSRGDISTWMAGLYDEFQNAMLGEQPAALEWGDLRSDNYGNTGYGDTRVYMNAIDASQAQYNWEFLYRVIDRCNVGIAKFHTIPNIQPADYNDQLGQCYGMRALMYFYAIRVWGDVPLVTEPWDGELTKSYVPRSPVNTVKTQILSDLDNAFNLLNTSVTGPRKFYFNRGAAWALKTDVHMWFKEYTEALEASNYFVGNASYELVGSAEQWKNIFLDPSISKETIFNMSWTDDLRDGANTWAQRVGASNTNNTYQISRTIYNEFVTRLRSGKGKDGRFWNVLDTVRLSIAGGRDASNNPIRVGFNHYGLDGTTKNTKFSPLSSLTTERWVVLSTNTSFVQLPIYRLADVLLLRAEALNQLDMGAAALDIVNSIRNRVGYTANAHDELDPADKAAVENLILKERQLEFMAEGKRWFDLMRTGKVIEVMDPVMMQRQQDYKVTVSGFGDPGRILFPIYFKEFEANPALRGHQNPPYTEG